MYAKVVEAPVPTSAYTTGHCHATPGRPFFDYYRQQCVDAAGHSGYSPPPPAAILPEIGGAGPLRDIRETADASRICKPWLLWGAPQSPLVKNDGAKPAGRSVCDNYWGMNTASYPDVAWMSPISVGRLCHSGNPLQGAKRANNWVFWIIFLALIIVAVVLIKS